MPSKDFATYDYDDAVTLVGTTKESLPRSGQTRYFPLPSTRFDTNANSTIRRNSRRSITAIIASEMYGGDMWLNGDGFIGQLPPRALPGYASILADIEAGFVSENVIKEVVDTHVGGLLGREPIWSFLAEDPNADADPESSFANLTGESLTPWWNRGKALKTLQRAAQITLCEGRAVYRLFIPSTYNDSEIRAPDIVTALGYIYTEVVHADRGGVFTDPDTQQDIGIFLYEEHDANGDVSANCAELSFLDDQGNTVCKVVRDKGVPSDYGPYKLGGHLLVYELQRDPLVTEQVQSNQRCVNLAHTMMMRNVNLAGSRERTITNAQPPLPRPAADTDPAITSATPKTADGRFPGVYRVGANAVNWVMGVPIYGDDNLIKGYTNPNVNIADPVSVETFEKTINKEKEAIYSQCHQRHVLIVDKADTSGRAREVARREFERSLKKTKTELDVLGRWKLEATLRLAAQVSNQTSRYIGLRADFNTLIDAGEPDPAMIQQALELRKPGGVRLQPIISDETCRNICGVDDAGAELKRIQAESGQPPADPTPLPPGADGDQPGNQPPMVN